MKVYVVLGAYGRVYSDAREALEDWWEGKPFITLDGPSCTVESVPKLIENGYTHVQILDYEMHETFALIHIGSNSID